MADEGMPDTGETHATPSRDSWPMVCPGCGLSVPYHSSRRMCRTCGRWAHRPGPRLGPDFDCIGSDGVCHMCREGKLNRKAVDSWMLKDVGAEPSDLDVGLFVQAFFLFCPDEQKIIDVTGLDPDDVRTWSSRLRASDVWTEDGKVGIDGDVDLSDVRQEYVWILLVVLCAQGLIARRKDDKWSSPP